jgi:aspartokinase/homoserine dehydrogenase 1
MNVHRLSTKLLKDAQSFRQISEVLLDVSSHLRSVVVLSAINGMDEYAEELIARAVNFNPQPLIDKFFHRHHQLSLELKLDQEQVKPALEDLTLKISDLAFGIHLTKQCTPRTRDLIHTLIGEAAVLLLHSLLLQKGVSQVHSLDPSANLILAKQSQPYPSVDWEQTRLLIKNWADQQRGLILLGNLLATAPNNQKLSLGKNSGDYVAGLIAAAVGSPELTVWLDEDGIPAAPTDLVTNPKRIRQMSYEESMEMSYFGSEFLHPYTILPLMKFHIPLTIRNLDTPQTISTEIKQVHSGTQNKITGLTCIKNVSILNVEGGGMVGIPGFAARVFAALSQAQVNIIMISQASSEHSICIVIKEEETGRAVRALEKELESERQTDKIGPIDLIQPCAIVAVIGDGMRGFKGLSGKIFGAVGQSDVNILAIAQGSSERNISFTILAKEAKAALQGLYHAFFGDEA